MAGALLVLHLICAAGAIAAFWIAVIAPKRGAMPRRIDRSFARAVQASAATGGLLAVSGMIWPDALSVLSDGDRAATRHFMWFVAYLSILMVAPVQHGLAAIDAGPSPVRLRSRLHLSLNLAALGGAVALFPASLIWRAWPFLLAVPAGFLIGLRNMVYAGRASAQPSDWRREYLANLVTTGVVLHTAVFILAANRWPIVPASWAWAPWIGPVLVGGPMILWIRRSQKLEARS
jgi:hypothetical protein